MTQIIVNLVTKYNNSEFYTQKTILYDVVLLTKSLVTKCAKLDYICLLYNKFYSNNTSHVSNVSLRAMPMKCDEIIGKHLFFVYFPKVYKIQSNFILLIDTIRFNQKCSILNLSMNGRIYAITVIRNTYSIGNPPSLDDKDASIEYKFWVYVVLFLETPTLFSKD